MIRTLGAYIIHYGKEYLAESIASLYPVCDEIAIFYTATPSHGHRGELKNPDTEAELRAICEQNDPNNKIRWKTGWYSFEGQHRAAYESYAKAAEFDVIVVSDYDEIWDAPSLKKAIQEASQRPERRFRVPFIHFWQGRDLVCRDGSQPERIINMNGEGDGYLELDVPVHHYGYAISDEMMKYKWSIHGHKEELRPNWLEEKWLARATEDVHPTNYNFWNAEPYKKDV